MNVPRGQDLSKYIKQTLATQVTEAFNAASKKIPETHWVGTDATQTAAAWRDMLNKVAATMNNNLGSLAQVLDKNIQDQITASSKAG